MILEHFLLAAVIEPTGAAMLEACGADVDATRVKLAQFLERPTTPLDWKPTYDAVVNGARVHAVSIGKPITIGHVLALLMHATCYARSLLEDQGVTRLGLLEYISHGTIHVESAAGLPPVTVVHGVEAAAASSSLYEIVLHNDDFTTREFVVDILRSLFDKCEDEANALARAVHETGLGVIGTAKLRAAIKKITKVTRLARKAEFPLRLSLRPAL